MMEQLGCESRGWWVWWVSGCCSGLFSMKQCGFHNQTGSSTWNRINKVEPHEYAYSHSACMPNRAQSWLFDIVYYSLYHIHIITDLMYVCRVFSNEVTSVDFTNQDVRVSLFDALCFQSNQFVGLVTKPKSYLAIFSNNSQVYVTSYWWKTVAAPPTIDRGWNSRAMPLVPKWAFPLALPWMRSNPSSRHWTGAAWTRTRTRCDWFWLFETVTVRREAYIPKQPKHVLPELLNFLPKRSDCNDAGGCTGNHLSWEMLTLVH